MKSVHDHPMDDRTFFARADNYLKMITTNVSTAALNGDYSEDGFMALYEVAIVTKDESGEEQVWGPSSVLAKTKEAAIAIASADAGADVVGKDPQVFVRPFVTGS